MPHVNKVDLEMAVNNILDLVSSAEFSSGKRVRWGFDTEMEADPILIQALKIIKPILEREYDMGYDAGYDDRDSEDIVEPKEYDDFD